MNPLRTHAFVAAAAPVALLIDLAAPVAAADEPLPSTPEVPRAVCDTPAVNAVLTAQGGIALRKCSDAKVTTSADRTPTRRAVGRAVPGPGDLPAR